MEMLSSSESDMSPRRRLLQRSCSVQPEILFETSPYSTSKQKSKNPGRSLTEIFTARKTRSSSSDSSARRRTLTTGTPIVQCSNSKKNESVSLNRSFSEASYSLSSSSYNRLDSADSGLSIGSIESNSNRRVYGLPPSDDEMCDSKEEMDISVVSDSRQSEEVRCYNERPEISIVYDSRQNDDEVECYNERPSCFWQFVKIALGILFKLVKGLIVMVTIAIILSIYFEYEKSQCELKKSEKMHLDELNKNFSMSVIGQEMAINVILNSLRDFEKDEMKSPLVLWMVGWSGSGKTYTANILRNVFSAFNVITVLPTLYSMNNDVLLKQEVLALYNQLHLCSYNIIVIDGWDEDNQPLQIVEVLISNLRRESKGKTMIILCGIKGSHYLNRAYLDILLKGKERDDLQINDFEAALKTVNETRELKKVVSDFVIVPFLPMGLRQVSLCIMEELKRLERSDFISKDYSVDDIIKQVIKQLTFVPPSSPLMASTGCKRVQPLVQLLLFKSHESDFKSQ